MDALLSGFSVSDPTWFYLSFLLIVSVYFRFTRFWSIRNLDLVLLLGIAPGILLLPNYPVTGFAWLFSTTGLWLVRMLFDPLLERRPKLEPNMNSAGLAFLCGAAVLFLMAKVVTEPPAAATVKSVRDAEQFISRQRPVSDVVTADGTAVPAESMDDTPGGSVPSGPGATLIVAPVVHLTKAVTDTKSAAALQPNPLSAESESAASLDAELLAARLIAVLAHLAVVTGLVFVGRIVFNDTATGIATATLYMLNPCTAFDVERASHVLPAAFITWALCAYRRPMISGLLLGLACGTLFFPIFLVPLWLAFYGRRGGLAFGLAFGLVTAGLFAAVYFAVPDQSTFVRQTIGYIHWTDLQLQGGDRTAGFWYSLDAVYRIPVFVAFLILLAVLTFWPVQRNLNHLTAHSCAVILGTQFWYPREGGVYILWYLPLLLVVMFRPTLRQHVAPEQLSWFGRQIAPTDANRATVTTTVAV